jgi:tRNA-splicing ligase RtcB
MIHTGTKWDKILEPLDEYRYLIPRSYNSAMKVDCVIYSSPQLLPHACRDLSLEQAANVACLPGIVEHSLAMPDMHQGYGFPIGGVAAMDPEVGVVSPGGVGFDINCGVRLLATSLHRFEVQPRIEALVSELYKSVPAGTGSDGRLKLNGEDLSAILETGSNWTVERGYAELRDLDHTEEYGCMPDADASAVSEKAKTRGASQLGTLGSGNHFLEVQYVERVLDKDVAAAFGLAEGQICVMIHCGSRGLGHQVCTDFVASMKPLMEKYKIMVPDRELACLPVQSKEGKRYLAAMSAAANFAFANRQCISQWVAESLVRMFGGTTKLELIYDVAHNMAKLERHCLRGSDRTLLVHRKGATRAFPAGRAELPAVFASIGQPVIIPGDMGRASYVLVGTERALSESFGSVCHGAGRLLSRTQARKGRQSKDVTAQLLAAGVVARAGSREGLTEEVPEAYKSIDDVIAAVAGAGLAKPVVRLKPVGVVKG